MNGTLWIIAIACGAVLIVAFKWLAKRRAFHGRTPISLEEIQKSVDDKVSLHTFTRVFRALGEAYSIDPRLIRPDDSLKTLLDMDSWVLDAGTEKMNQWLAQDGIDEGARKPATVLDLLLLVEGKSGSNQRPVQS